jgi:hypothetical protein
MPIHSPQVAHVVQERWPRIGVVVTSGRAHLGPHDLSEKVAFLSKPYLPDTVIDVIRQMATPQVVEAASTDAAQFAERAFWNNRSVSLTKVNAALCGLR